MLFDAFKKIADSLTINESIAYIATLIGIIVALYLYIRNQIMSRKETILKEYIDTDEELVSYLDEIEPQLKYERSTYKKFLEKNLMRIDNILGKLTFFSFRALDYHILFSVVYSFVFFYVLWLFGNEWKIGNLYVIENDNRLSTSILLVFTLLVVYYSFKHIDNIITFLKKHLPYSSQIRDYIINFITYLVLGIGILLVAFVVLYKVGGIGLVGIGLGAVAVVNIARRWGGRGGIVILLIGAGPTFANLGIGLDDFGILFLLFFVILPVVNAFFDYISMYFSRFFAYRILKDSKGLIVLDIILDLLVAVILFFLLAHTLYYAIDLANIYIIKDEVSLIPIESYKVQLLTNPLSKDVLPITLMLFSTLVPTLAHIGLALFSFIADIMIKPQLHSLYEQIETLLVSNNITKRKKEEIAINLASYDLALHYKVIILFQTILGFLLLGCFAILAVKLGWYVFEIPHIGT